MKIIKFFFFICFVSCVGVLGCNLILIYKTIGDINPPIVCNITVVKKSVLPICNKTLEFRVIDQEGIIFSQKILTPQKFEIIAF